MTDPLHRLRFACSDVASLGFIPSGHHDEDHMITDLYNENPTGLRNAHGKLVEALALCVCGSGRY